MDDMGVAVVAGIVVLIGLVSRRIESTPLTLPMLVVGAGLLIGPEALDVVDFEQASGSLAVLAEVTLVLVLFSDAARIDLGALRRHWHLPVRLLGVGMPLTIVLGAVAGMLVLDLGWAEAALLAAVLAPTDAALGQAVVTDPRIPVRIRQGLNVESGLNDGLAVPVITLFIALVLEEEGVISPSSVVRDFAEQVGFGVAVGVVVGVAGAWLVDRFARQGWMTGVFQQVSMLALAVLAFAAAGAVDGNGFIAAFVAGLCVGNLVRHACDELYGFTEAEGKLLSLLTFLLFGGVAASASSGEVDPAVVVYVVCSLTVVRMLPVALGVSGLRFGAPTKLFLGWFGPRGLASIIFGLDVLHELGAVGEQIWVVVTWTVLASVFLHGLTASPLTDRFAAYTTAVAAVRPGMAEMQPVAEMPTRWWVPGRRAAAR